MNRTLIVPGEPALGAGLDFLFRPPGVAIVGASNDPNRIGGRPIAFMRRGGYAGRVFPVNPGHAEVQGLPAYASILDVRDNIDLAVIALPAALVSEAVDQCIARGIKALTIFTSGFAEIDAEGAAAQDRIREQCRSAGVRLLGPNCLGLMNVRTGMFLTFSTVLDAVTLIPGSVSMASQSGAFGAYFCGLAAQRGIGFSQYVATWQRTPASRW
jgi:acyl-CoA synthetase (NDP forming)